MFWDDEYKRNERVWGERPSELAVAVVEYLQRYNDSRRAQFISGQSVSPSVHQRGVDGGFHIPRYQRAIRA